MHSEQHKPIDRAKSTTDRQGVFAPIAADCWNQNSIRSLNNTTEFGLQEFFGSLEIIDQARNVTSKDAPLLAQASDCTINQLSEYELIKASGDRQAMRDHFKNQAELYGSLAQATTQPKTERQNGSVSNIPNLDAIDPSQLSKDAQFGGPAGNWVRYLSRSAWHALEAIAPKGAADNLIFGSSVNAGHYYAENNFQSVVNDVGRLSQDAMHTAWNAPGIIEKMTPEQKSKASAEATFNALILLRAKAPNAEVATEQMTAVMKTVKESIKAAEEIAKTAPERAHETKRLLYDYLRDKGLTPQEFVYAGVPKRYFDDMAGPSKDNQLQMGKHFDDGKPPRGTESAREAKEAGEVGKANEALELNRIAAEGWAGKQEASTVNYLRNRNETITKNKFEGTFSSDSPYRRQTDAVEWELKSISGAERSGTMVDRIVKHAQDGSTKFTGTDHIGRVLIDARNQSFMNEALAKKCITNAFLRAPSLKEIRIIGKDFDLCVNRGQHTAIRK